MTKNGRIIFNLIEEVACHPTAEEIYHMIYKSGLSMSVATIYNNLNSLCEEGQIRKISMPNQPDRYDKCERHDHLICLKCGKIIDLFLKDRKKEFEKEIEMPIGDYDLQLYHVCDSCKD